MHTIIRFLISRPRNQFETDCETDLETDHETEIKKTCETWGSGISRKNTPMIFFKKNATRKARIGFPLCTVHLFCPGVHSA